MRSRTRPAASARLSPRSGNWSLSRPRSANTDRSSGERSTSASRWVPISNMGESLNARARKRHHLQRRKVRIVEVVNHDDERLALGYAPEKSRDCVEQPKTRLLRIDPLQPRSFSLNWRGPNKLGHQRCHLLNPGAKRFGQLGEIRTFGALAE